MAAPTVVNTANTTVKQGNASLTMPASIVSGRLLLAFIATYSGYTNAEVVSVTGCTRLEDTPFTYRQLSMWAKIAAGGDTMPVTTWAPAWAAITYQVSGWSGSIADIGHATFALDAPGATPPNPPALAMPYSADWLWVAAEGAHGGTTQTAPSGYSGVVNNLFDIGGGSIEILATATRALTAASEDPGAFGGGVAIDGYGVAATVAIPPVGWPPAGGGSPSPANMISFFPGMG